MYKLYLFQILIIYYEWFLIKTKASSVFKLVFIKLLTQHKEQ